MSQNETKDTEEKTKKLNMIITNLIRVLLITIIIEQILTQNYSQIFLAVLTLALTYYPSLLEKRFKVYLPSTMQIIITLFIFGAQYLGEMKDFYRIFSWWDILLHTISGIIIGIIGFMFVYLLNEKHDKRVKLSPFFVAMFAFCFAVTVGVFWEFFEFGVDRIFELNMQKFRYPELGDDGLLDTMTDLIVDSIGALVTAIIGYIYMRKEDAGVLTKWFKGWFIKEKTNIKKKAN